MTTETLTAKLAEARLTESVDPATLQLFTLARKCGVTRAQIDFSGCGDSGDINDTTLYHLKADDEGKQVERYLGREDSTEDTDRLKSLLNEYFNNVLYDRIDWDWVNNEGGGGCVEIDFLTGNIEVSGYVYIQESTDGVFFNALGLEEQ